MANIDPDITALGGLSSVGRDPLSRGLARTQDVVGKRLRQEAAEKRLLLVRCIVSAVRVIAPGGNISPPSSTGHALSAPPLIGRRGDILRGGDSSKNQTLDDHDRTLPRLPAEFAAAERRVHGAESLPLTRPHGHLLDGRDPLKLLATCGRKIPM